MNHVLFTVVLMIVLGISAGVLAQTQEQLIAGAKKEGALVVYASATAQQLQMYFAAFNKKYPFVKTEFFRTGKQKLVSKILLEEQAKQHIADVLHTSVIDHELAVEPYRRAFADLDDAEAVPFAKRLVGQHQRIFAR